MIHSNDMGSLTLKQRLCCLLAVTEIEAEALLRSGQSATDTAAIARRVGLKPADVHQIIRSKGHIESARIDVNNIKRLQLYQIPNLPPSRYQAIMAGRPYFSLHEFEQASGLSKSSVADLFSAPVLESIDNVTGRRRSFEPVYGKYMALQRLDFERSHTVEALGFVEHPASAGAPFRLLVSNESEENQNTYELKDVLGGNVFPVVQDAEGFEHYFVPATIDVWFRKEISEQQALEILDELGLRTKLSRSKVGFYQAELGTYPEDMHIMAATLDTIKKMHHRTEIAFAEPTEIGFEDFTPVNEKEPLDFEDTSTGERTWNLDLIEAHAAHEITTGSSKVTVLIIDSGIRPDHQDLIGALRPDWDTLDLNYDLGMPEQELSPVERYVAHGTKVASIAIGRGPSNGSRVMGVAPGCWLLPVKISGSPFGQSYGLRAAAIREAIGYLSPGQRGVFNISWSTNGEHLGIREALFQAHDKGIAIVTSAGNYHPHETQIPDKPHYPSAYAFLPGSSEADVAARRRIPGLASVSAVDALGNKTTYSYYGANSVTVSAPGGEPGRSGMGIFVASTPADYAYDSGTSFSAPHVAGLMALLLSAKPGLTAQEALDIIQTTATDLDERNPSYAGMLGAGLINARAALVSLSLPDASSTALGMPVTVPPNGQGSALLNINTANREQFEALPFIGRWSSNTIISYRNIHGPFAEIWDLARTGAVDRWTIDQIKNFITADATPISSTLATNDENTFAKAPRKKLNINKATVTEFSALPNIGNWSATQLALHRNDHGPYDTIWDMALPGVIDQWTIREIMDFVTV